MTNSVESLQRDARRYERRANKFFWMAGAVFLGALLPRSAAMYVLLSFLGAGFGYDDGSVTAYESRVLKPLHPGLVTAIVGAALLTYVLISRHSHPTLLAASAFCLAFGCSSKLGFRRQFSREEWARYKRERKREQDQRIERYSKLTRR
jgi:hypothetical protein